MKSLPDVTLIAYDGGSVENVNQTVRVLNYCCKDFEFAHVKFWSSIEPTVKIAAPHEIVFDPTKGRSSDANEWEISGIKIETSHCLFVSRDGMIANPDKWSDAWLEYDYIGAPWPAWWQSVLPTKNRVGNSGFCLRSKKLLEAVKLTAPFFWINAADIWCSQVLHHWLSNQGIKFADVLTASDFSWEMVTEEGRAGWGSFGYHGYVGGKTKETYENLILSKGC